MISGGHHARLRFVRNGCRSSADYFHHPRTMNLKLWGACGNARPDPPRFVFSPRKRYCLLDFGKLRPSTLSRGPCVPSSLGLVHTVVTISRNATFGPSLESVWSPCNSVTTVPEFQRQLTWPVSPGRFNCPIDCSLPGVPSSHKALSVN